MPSRQYPRAPITEAVFGFEFAEPIDEDTVKKAQVRFLGDHPFVEEIRQPHHFNINPLSKTLEVAETKGFKLATLDQLDVIVVANTRLSLSRNAPYAGWEAFRARADAAWTTWKAVAGYRKISRIGVRYINRIDIPWDGKPIELSDYFNLTIEIPQPPFPSLDHQTTQAIFTFNDCQMIVNMGLVPPALVNHISYALDFDFARDKSVPQSDAEIWRYIDSLRDRKNMLFEASITDRTRALFG